MLCLLLINNRHSGFTRANIRYGKNGREGRFLNGGRVKAFSPLYRGRARIPTTSRIEFFVTIDNNQRLLTVFRKNFILDVTGFLVLPLLFLL